MYGEIVKAGEEETTTLGDVVVLTGTRVNAYDTPRLYDRLPISSGFLRARFLLPADALSCMALSHAQVVKDPRSHVFTPDYFWRPGVCAGAGADVTSYPYVAQLLHA